MRNIFLQNHGKNEAGRLASDLFLFFKNAFYEVKASGHHLIFNIPVYQKKLDQYLDFNFRRYVQRAAFKLCNLVHTNIIKSLTNFLTFKIILTDLE